jgi:hypothetical protein
MLYRSRVLGLVEKFDSSERVSRSMAADPYAQWMGTEMDVADVDQLLAEAGYGILALADDDEPYSIPVSFGYDDADVYFAFVKDSPSNEKFEFIADGKRARLLVTEIAARFDWQSVAVTGSVDAIDFTDDDWSHLVATLENNPWFSTAFEDADSVDGVRGWRLVPEEIRGLEVTQDQW